jgi:hypothetical protein
MWGAAMNWGFFAISGGIIAMRNETSFLPRRQTAFAGDRRFGEFLEHMLEDRLGMHEARGENRQAADCYRKVIEFIREHPDDYDPGFDDMLTKLVNRLDPPVAT